MRPLLAAAMLCLAAAGALGRAAPGDPAFPPKRALACPAGTVEKGGAPPEQYEAWCEGRPDAYGNPRRHGPSRTWYDDGGPWIELAWFEGKRDGPFVEYHRGGRKAREGTYRLDAKVGTWTVWSEAGTVLERAEWRDDLLHGPFVAFHPNGRKRMEGQNCQGAQCGLWITWDDAGREQGRSTFEVRRATP